MADRLYDEACRWVEDRFSPNGKAIRPNLTIHVGMMDLIQQQDIPRVVKSLLTGGRAKLRGCPRNDSAPGELPNPTCDGSPAC